MITYESQKLWLDNASSVMIEFTTWLNWLGFRYVFANSDRIYVLFDQTVAGIWFPIRFLITDDILNNRSKDQIKDELIQFSENLIVRNSELQPNFNSAPEEWYNRSKNFQIAFVVSPWE